MGRRSKGEGAVYLRGDGRWEAQLRLGVGKRKSVYGRTRREVLGKLREARWELKRGLPVRSRKLSTRSSSSVAPSSGTSTAPSTSTAR